MAKPIQPRPPRDTMLGCVNRVATAAAVFAVFVWRWSR